MDGWTPGEGGSFIAAAGALLVGYLLGSIPFGLVLTRAAGLGDIRSIGSGNIGATNVLRTGRRDLAAATLLLDAGKAGLAYLACRWTAAGLPGALPSGLDAEGVGLIAGAAAFVGHCFPVWLGFRGGKGVATFLGLLLFALWQVGLAFAAIWLLTAALFRMSSLAALVATLAAPGLAYLIAGPFAAGVIAALAGLIFWRHHANIARLLSGTEPRIGRKNPSGPDQRPAPGGGAEPSPARPAEGETE